MYRYVFDLFSEQQDARRKAIEYIYSQLPEVFDPSNISIVKQSNGETTSILYQGHLIGMIYEYYDGSTWNIEAKRVPFDETEEEDL